MPITDRLGSATLGHWLMDAEHRQLIVLLNEVEIAISSGQNEEGIRARFDKLASWASLHFAHEDDSISRCGYDGAERHIAEHRELVKTLSDYIASEPLHGLDRRLRALDTFRFLEDWVVSHIENEDAPFAAHLARKNMR